MNNRYVLILLMWILVWVLPVAAQDYGKKDSPAAQVLSPRDPNTKEFYITTVHIDGKTSIKGEENHPPEAFPKQALPKGGGLILTPPNEQGKWEVRSFIFQPSQLMVYVGDTVTLHFVGVQGPSHTIAIDGQAEPVILKRGEMKTVTFVADKVGTVRYASLNRQPSMQGEIIVLPRG
jgi:hypothetical protein